MRRFLNLLPAVLAAGALLAAGCRTSHTPSNGNISMISLADALEEVSIEMRARAHAHYAAAVIHDMNDEPELALKEYYEAALNDPEDESLTLDISRRLMLARQSEKALALLESAARRRTASGAIFGRLGLVYSQLGKSAEALDASRAAIKKSPRLLAGYQNLFQIHLLASREAKALDVLDEAAKQQDTGAAFLIGLAELYASYVSQFPTRREAVEPKAIAVLERAAKLDPAALQLRLRLADGFFMMGKSDQAAQLYEKSLGQLEDIPFLRDSVRSKLADIYLRARDNKRAAEQLEDIVRADPSNAQAYYLLGNIAYGEKRWKDAVENLEKTVLFRPGFEQAYYDLAAAQIAASQNSQALATLEIARGKFAQNFLMEFLFGVAYSQARAYTEAVQRFTAAEVVALATDTKRLTEDFYFQFGAASERKGDYAQAEKYFQKAIELSPDSAEALNYLGYMWAERGENLEKAREMIGRALKVEPDSEAYLDSMGWVLFKLGRLKPALEYILKAVAASEKPDAELYNHLGDIYAAMNEPDKARDAWEKSLAIEPNEKIKTKLATPKKEQ